MTLQATRGYRPDIDGLRALAVLPVLFFHAGFSAFSGGYVGVDVFFVISGYLITRLIDSEIGSGRFSVIHFYERRARRILPALFEVMATSGLLAWVLMTPGAFKEFAESVFATSLFSANIYFWKSLNYFSTSGDFRLLLHTWSLGVEEQFYVLWPMFLLLCAKFSRRVLHIGTLLILAVSLAGSIIFTDSYPKESFYLLPGRAWELLTGAVFALGLVPRWQDRLSSEVAAAVGLLMICIPVAVYDRTTTFPGAAAVPPCLGALLVIHSGGGTLVGRVLSWRPVVFVGLISYSLYLWHWPLLATLRTIYGSVELPADVALPALAISFLMATLSWHFIEGPFRRRDLVGRTTIFALSSMGMVTTIAICLVVIVSDGLPSRLSPRTYEVAAGASDFSADRSHCENRLPSAGLCHLGRMDTAPTVLLWGDSHAGALRPALDEVLKSAGLAGVLASRSACPPLLGVRRIEHHGMACAQFNDAVLAMVEANGSHINTVVVTARWALNVTGRRAPGEAGPGVVLVSMNGNSPADNGRADNRALVRRGLAALVDRLRRGGKHVVLLGDVPEIGWDVPRTMVARLRLGLPQLKPPDLSMVRRRTRAAVTILKSLANRPGVDFLPIAPLLCHPGCPVLNGGRPTYVDDDHLSVHGARDLLGPKLVGLIWPSIPSMQK